MILVSVPVSYGPLNWILQVLEAKTVHCPNQPLYRPNSGAKQAQHIKVLLPSGSVSRIVHVCHPPNEGEGRAESAFHVPEQH